MERAGRAAPPTTTAWSTGSDDVLRAVPEGVAVIDAEARFVDANPAAVLLCGLDPSGVAGAPSPFLPATLPEPAGAVGPAGAGELTVGWRSATGQRREFAYVVAPIAGQRRWVMSFRDVTSSRLRERRLAAIAKAASGVASKRSLVGTLEALAQEVAGTDALAGVQVLTLNASGDRLHVMGAAGFGREEDFFDKLMECRALGARLVMLEALETRQPLVEPDRYDVLMSDPAWAPLHDMMRAPKWNSFVSVPLLAREEPVGILNAFFAPGQVVGEHELEFLLAMAHQAAMAVDHAALLERGRDLARREERQKLARDLHDSVVQHVFSIMMQARSLGVLVARGRPPSAEQVAEVADDLSSSAEAVLADLRGMVVELRPATTQGLASALHSLVDTTVARTGLHVSLHVDDPSAELARLAADLLEDAYRVVAEALHNSVKHADPTAIEIRVAVASRGPHRRLLAEVVDDGRGLAEADAVGGSGGAGSGGVGMTVMRERAARWGGTVRVLRPDTGGTCVRLSLPLPTSLPTTSSATGLRIGP